MGGLFLARARCKKRKEQAKAGAKGRARGDVLIKADHPRHGPRNYARKKRASETPVIKSQLGRAIDPRVFSAAGSRIRGQTDTALFRTRPSGRSWKNVELQKGF